MMLYWEDTSDELLRTNMTLEEAFELKPPMPLGRVHAFAVTVNVTAGFDRSPEAICGFEFPEDRRTLGQRVHPFGASRECPDCRRIVRERWGDDAWLPTLP
jgi:hypothetical protein